ncbi:MAG TPA: multicopper oxidase domain-containing protein [Thermoanaerobaculia bacterium]
MQRSATAFSLAAALSLLLLPSAAAQPANSFPCPADITGAELVQVPELVSNDGTLSGTLYTVSELARMTVASAGPGSAPYCTSQWVRAYRRSAPTNWNPGNQQINAPQPGPTLRARLGDVVNLTFLNVIDASKFPGVDDNRCDETSVYPGKRSATNPHPDEYPDCFAGSVFTNVHYHGTHTNPNTTGDNVFLQIRPSPRKTDGTNAPVITAQSVKPAFDEFFAACRQQLATNAPKIWPRIWSDLPDAIRTTLMEPLKQYAPAWWTTNEKLIANGDWPQYYVGAYPYCFRLPQYTAVTTQPTDADHAHTPHTRGAGQAEIDEAQAPQRPLLMGQAPGTHWYHAHKHGSTTINVSNGMTGVFVIEGEYDDVLAKYYDPKATGAWKPKVLVVQQLGNAPGLMTNKGGGPGPDFSVNGQLRPVITMPGNSVQMWRIANTSGRAGIYFPAPLVPNDVSWRQLAQDGVQFTDANYQASLNQPFLLASGNRADLLVKAPAYKANGNNTYNVLVFNTVDPSDRPPRKPNVKPFTLLTVKVTANGPDMQFLPNAAPFPPFLADIRDDEISGTKVLNFASSGIPPVPGTAIPSQHTIDGKKFDGELGVVVALNRAEEWKIVNATYPPANSNQIAHPFHIHINPFQVTEVFDPNEPLSSAIGAGTIAVAKDATGNTSTVTGTGTNFARDLRPGDWVWVNSTTAGDPTMGPAMVVATDGKFKMTIANAPGGTGNISTATYRTVVPLYTIDRANARPGQCVLDPNDPQSWKPCSKTEPAKDRIWWDVFSIPSGSTFTDGTKTYQIPGYFKMRSRFVDYSGYYVLHCHILAHEDRGMMTVVEVAPLQTPYSHH